MAYADKETIMLATIEVIIEKDGVVRLLEPLQPSRPIRALLTLLEPLNQPISPKRSLRDCIGLLKNSSMFEDDPVTLQRAFRDEWD
jgi:hypothetical protein